MEISKQHEIQIYLLFIKNRLRPIFFMQKQEKFQNKFFICHIKYRNKQWEINSVAEGTAYIRVGEGSIPSFPTTSS